MAMWTSIPSPPPPLDTHNENTHMHTAVSEKATSLKKNEEYDDHACEHIGRIVGYYRCQRTSS